MEQQEVERLSNAGATGGKAKDAGARGGEAKDAGARAASYSEGISSGAATQQAQRAPRLWKIHLVEDARQQQEEQQHNSETRPGSENDSNSETRPDSENDNVYNNTINNKAWMASRTRTLRAVTAVATSHSPLGSRAFFR
jgi:hypothetical protein